MILGFSEIVEKLQQNVNYDKVEMNTTRNFVFIILIMKKKICILYEGTASQFKTKINTGKIN